MGIKFYSLEKILNQNCIYNMIIGERSNGKTYSVLEYALKQYQKDGSQLAIIRRFSEDFKSKRASQMFDALIENGLIEKYTDGKFKNLTYWGGKWYFSNYDEKHKLVRSDIVFAYSFSIASQEHDKSTSYPKVNTILFDEFLTRGTYLPDEFILLLNVLSTIIRYRDNVKIFMLGNTVNKYCPYFSEMGLNHIKDMKQGSIDVYKYGESELSVAVEYCGSPNKSKPSDKYFAFNNPRLQMVTKGVWEIDIYPHRPVKFRPKDIIFYYFIKFEDEILQCEIVNKDNNLFTFIHTKTTPIKDNNKDVIYSLDYNPQYNYYRRINNPNDNMSKKIYQFFLKDKVFYQNNEVGEIVRNYLLACKAA